MPVHKAVITATEGLHARPAAVFVRAVMDTGFPVTIARRGAVAVDARSLLQVMTADFEQGCEVELGITGEAHTGAAGQQAAVQVLADLAALLASQGANRLATPEAAPQESVQSC